MQETLEQTKTSLTKAKATNITKCKKVVNINKRVASFNRNCEHGLWPLRTPPLGQELRFLEGFIN